MTYQLTVLYKQPEDPQAFDAYYESTHAPLAARLPGLLSYTAMHPGPDEHGTTPLEYLTATLVFEDIGSFGAAMASDVGRAAGADLANFATGGATMLTGEVSTYVAV